MGRSGATGGKVEITSRGSTSGVKGETKERGGTRGTREEKTGRVALETGVEN